MTERVVCTFTFLITDLSNHLFPCSSHSNSVTEEKRKEEREGEKIGGG